MLETVSCTRILAQASTASLVRQVQRNLEAKGVTLRIDDLPGLPEVFPQLGGSVDAAHAEVKPYPPSDNPVDLRAPSLYIHSSGSTGYPKSVHFTHRRLLLYIGSSKSCSHLCSEDVGLTYVGAAQMLSATAAMHYSARWVSRASIQWAFSYSLHTRSLEAGRS